MEWPSYLVIKPMEEASIFNFSSSSIFTFLLVGRTGNVWMSPEGCAVFSLRLEFALDAMLGKHLSLMQHLAALAIVLAVKSLPVSQV